MHFFPVLAIIAFLGNVVHSNLFDVPIPYPWFIEHIAFEPVDLPPGVSITLVTDENGRLSSEFIVFKNTSSTPLLMIGRPEDDYTEFDAIPFELQQGTGPLYKIINGQAYVWRIKYNHPGSGYYYAWFKENERDDSVWLYASTNQIRCQNSIMLDLEPQNQYGGDRPKDVQIPNDQHILLPVIYGSEKVEIPITISYTINTEYRSFESIQQEQTLIYFGCFIVILAIPLIGVWMIRDLLKSNFALVFPEIRRFTSI